MISGVLDFLRNLDLVQADKNLLQRYMGKIETDAFLVYRKWENKAVDCA